MIHIVADETAAVRSRKISNAVREIVASEPCFEKPYSSEQPGRFFQRSEDGSSTEGYKPLRDAGHF